MRFKSKIDQASIFVSGSLLACVLLSWSLALGYITPRQYYDGGRKLFLKSADTKWDFFSSSDLSSKSTYLDHNLQFVARSPRIYEGTVQPTLTLRIDKTTAAYGGSGTTKLHWPTAKEYAERWLKDFPKFGFEMQSAQEAHYGALSGYEIEATTKASAKVSRHARQLIVAPHDAHEVWVFTCSADDKHFAEAWQHCEKILKTAEVRKP